MGTVPVAQAHPADMYFHSQTIRLSPDGVRVDWHISPGPLLAAVVWEEADQDGDGQVSPDETQSWVAPHLAAFSATLDDGVALTWRLESLEWPQSFTDLQVGDAVIRVQLTADWPVDLDGCHRLQWHNQYEEAASTNWFYLQAVDGLVFQTPDQSKGQLTFDLAMPAEASAPSSVSESDGEWQTYWESGVPNLPGLAVLSGPSQTDPPRGVRARLTDLVREPDVSLPFYLMALAVAAMLGAMHALTPGHGKTVVAAYLVALRGAVRHAVALGTVVTVTHTGSVFILGLLTLLASRYILPTRLFPLLEVFSGLLIVALGATLLYQYWRAWRTASAECREQGMSSPVYERDGASGRTKITLYAAVRESGPPHTHSHAFRQYVPTAATDASWRSLLTLGISGGLVPCPDAIAILLVALAINRVMLGLSLIIAFSLGLASVLIVIGVTMVRSRNLLTRLGAFDRLATFAPVANAVVLVGVGGGLAFSAAQNAGPLTRSAERLERETVVASDETGTRHAAERPFQVDQASVLYVAPDAAGHHQLFVTSLALNQPLPLTDEPFGVWDYALAPDGVTVAYTVLRDDGGTDLFRIDTDGGGRAPLLSLAEAGGSAPAWSPDGGRIVYERRDLTLNAIIVLPSLWWLDVEMGETRPLFQDSALPGISARWSPDGEWLSYVRQGNAEVEIYHLQDGRRHTVSSQTGQPVVWGPKGDVLLVTDMRPAGKRHLTHLLRFDIADETLIDLSGEGQVADMGAAWSPDGEWLSVVRKVYEDAQGTTGNQIWIMRPDGSQARPLAQDPDAHYSAPAWSPDGQYLLVDCYSLKASLARAEIRLLEVESGASRPVIAPGAQATWLP